MKNQPPRSCVHPSGRFTCGLHRPCYKVINLRQSAAKSLLGHDEQGRPVDNHINFPENDLNITNTQGVFEIPNPFSFWGTTFILEGPARGFSSTPDNFRFKPEARSHQEESTLLKDLLKGTLSNGKRNYSIGDLPRNLKLALAQTSKDPEVLEALARDSCRLEIGPAGRPVGMIYRSNGSGGSTPVILDHDMFEVLGNNPFLPDDYKLAMVLIPGVQGRNPVVGEYVQGLETHVWEYLRSNSYIPWGHFASNMAHDCIRYDVRALTPGDITGLRHLYYQRVYVKMAASLDALVKTSGNGSMDPLMDLVPRNRPMDTDELERLRMALTSRADLLLDEGYSLPFTSTMWGWNYGFDFSASGYRLHASHQQIHQQFAMIPPFVETVGCERQGGKTGRISTYAVGDNVRGFIRRFEDAYGRPFFKCYMEAIYSNKRLDKRADLPANLVVQEDENAILCIPKAQRSQGEVQIITKKIGNILEADTETRSTLDRLILLAVRTLANMGAEMVTCYEVSKRFDERELDQRLMYCFLPRHAQSPGAFSERQGRWVTGHFPEDFARAFSHNLDPWEDGSGI